MKLVSLGLLLLFSCPLKAELLDTVQHNDSTFNLCAKERVSKLWFDIVDVGIYYKDCNAAQHIFDKQSKLLRFSYLRKVKGNQFSEGAFEYLIANLPEDKNNSCSGSYSALNNAYKTVTSGDAYDLYILEETGIKLYLNNQHLHTMEDTSCHIDYLNVWFGEETMDSQFHDLAERIKN